MKLTIVGIESAGHYPNERLVLKAKADLDIGNYVVLRADRAPDDSSPLSGDIKDAYWFNAFEVKSGDYIVLYTKDGRRSKKPIGSDRTSHFFYWGLPKAIWDTASVPVVIEGPEWETYIEVQDTLEPNPAVTTIRTGGSS